jgi:lysophospholipase L1-like esterase
MPSGSLVRRWGERVGLLLFGLLLAVLLLEAGMRLASRFVGERVDDSDEANRLTLLTLGDSHTYGVSITAQDAYPGQLAADLDLRAPGRYRVVNLGLPGMNSAEILARLPGWYARYRPHSAIVCVGVNNIWNDSETEPEQNAAGVRRWLSNLRVVRLARILRVNLQSRPTVSGGSERPELKRVQIDGATPLTEHYDAATGELLVRHRGKTRTRTVTLAEATARLAEDLEKMSQISQKWNVELVLLTYAAFPLPSREDLHEPPALMSDEMRDSGRRLGLPVIDVHDRFASLLADGGPRSRYFLTEKDGHPNAHGYAEIAALVAEHFEAR